jgi:hypothetical protein
MTRARAGVGTVEDQTSCKHAILSAGHYAGVGKGAIMGHVLTFRRIWIVLRFFWRFVYVGDACDHWVSARTRYLTTGGAAGIWLLRVAEKILHRSIDHALTRGLRRIDHDDWQATADRRAVHFGAHSLGDGMRVDAVLDHCRPNEQDQFGSCPRRILMREGLYLGQRGPSATAARGWDGPLGPGSKAWSAEIGRPKSSTSTSISVTCRDHLRHRSWLRAEPS